jgi:imidazolonepropionase-like amidohydrolase
VLFAATFVANSIYTQVSCLKFGSRLPHALPCGYVGKPPSVMRAFFLLSVVFFGPAVHGQDVVSNARRDIIFRSVNIVPMDRERVIPNQTVVIRNGRIYRIGNDGAVKRTSTALVIDGRGKYLMPGLAEMHAHIPTGNNLDFMTEVLTLYLANGITTIRGMLGHPTHIELRRLVQEGKILGPHTYITGPSFNGQSVKTPARGAEMVREQKAAGYDFLKLHPGLTKQTFPAIVAAAQSVKIPFVGHVSFNVGIWRAIEARYSSIDHLDGFMEAIVPGSDTLVESETGLFGAWIADRADATLLPRLVAALRTNQIYQVPTQALAERWLSPLPAEAFTMAPEMKYMDQHNIDGWVRAKNDYNNSPNFSKERATKLIDIRRTMLLACQRGGVPLLLGSDAPQVFNVPGFSIHHELRYLVEAGLTPYEALRTGTVNVAQYLKKTDSGTVSVGNVADLVLLSGNPLQDIGQTRAIEGVMMGTNWVDKAAIDSRLKTLEKR